MTSAQSAVPTVVHEQDGSDLAPSDPSRYGWMSWLAVILLMTGIGVGGLVLWSQYEFGSIAGSISYLRGARLIPEAYSITFETDNLDKLTVVTFNVKNYSYRPITVFGARVSCICMSTPGLPVVVPPGESRTLEVNARAASGSGDVLGKVTFYTNDTGFRELPVVVRGRVRSARRGQVKTD
jgi:Protein of unknown function (DUF1573)